MRSTVLLVITCSVLLRTVPISAVPISVKTDTDLGSAEPGDTFKTSSEPFTETSQSDLELTSSSSPSAQPKPKATDAPTEDKEASIEEFKATTSAPATTTEPQPTHPPTTNTPPVNCKDLEMETKGKYSPTLGDIPKSLEKDQRVLPINAIKLPQKSCKELYNDGYTKSGIYIIKPNKTEITVFCDMSICGGGWTIIQRRIYNDNIFNTDYGNYQRGFGDLSAGFWLGLDAIHELTSSSTELYIGMYRESPFHKLFSSALSVYYKSFQVGNEAEGYPLKVSEYSGILPDGCSPPANSGFWWYAGGDSLTDRHNGKKFSAYDKDQDPNEGVNCASTHKGGWWYGKDQCQQGNLNGEKIIWRSFRQHTPLSHSVMAIR